MIRIRLWLLCHQIVPNEQDLALCSSQKSLIQSLIMDKSFTISQIALCTKPTRLTRSV